MLEARHELSPLLFTGVLFPNRLSHQNLLIQHHLIVHLIPRYHRPHRPHDFRYLAHIAAAVQFEAYQVTAELEIATIHLHCCENRPNFADDS